MPRFMGDNGQRWYWNGASRVVGRIEEEGVNVGR